MGGACERRGIEEEGKGGKGKRRLGGQRSRSKKTSFLEQDFCPPWARFSAQAGKKTAAKNKPNKLETNLGRSFLANFLLDFGRSKKQDLAQKL